LTTFEPCPGRSLALAGVLLALALGGCSGLLDAGSPLQAHDAGGILVDSGAGGGILVDSGAGGGASAEVDAAEEPVVYGARYQGDAGACATVICSGAQVCCVVPIPSDAATPNPNNRCDYDCVAMCMDSCPAVSADGVDAAPVLTAGMHGGGLRQEIDDAAAE
jgi:hypothetical protein